VQLDDKLWVIGGMSDGVFLSDVLCFDLNTQVWTKGPSLPVASAYHTVAVHQGMIYVFGGLQRTEVSNKSTADSVFRLNPKIGIWKKVKAPLPIRRESHATVVGLAHI
jgi:N-acetylneuraminic acid mutarotase